MIPYNVISLVVPWGSFSRKATGNAIVARSVTENDTSFDIELFLEIDFSKLIILTLLQNTSF